MKHISQISARELPLKRLLKMNGIRYWQIVKRCLSKGIMINEPTLSRILNGIEEPSRDVKRELKRIEKQLLL